MNNSIYNFVLVILVLVISLLYFNRNNPRHCETIDVTFQDSADAGCETGYVLPTSGNPPIALHAADYCKIKHLDSTKIAFYKTPTKLGLFKDTVKSVSRDPGGEFNITTTVMNPNTQIKLKNNCFSKGNAIYIGPPPDKLPAQDKMTYYIYIIALIISVIYLGYMTVDYVKFKLKK